MATGTMESLWSKANQAQLAELENDSTAGRAYAPGEYFGRDGKLYRVTIAIPAGGAITPGTNCEETTVGIALKNAIYRYAGAANTVSFTIGGYAMGLLMFFPFYVRYSAGMYVGTVMVNTDGSVSWVGQATNPSMEISGITFNNGVMTFTLPSGYVGVYLTNTMMPDITIQ